MALWPELCVLFLFFFPLPLYFSIQEHTLCIIAKWPCRQTFSDFPRKVTRVQKQVELERGYIAVNHVMSNGNRVTDFLSKSVGLQNIIQVPS